MAEKRIFMSGRRLFTFASMTDDPARQQRAVRALRDVSLLLSIVFLLEWLFSFFSEGYFAYFTLVRVVICLAVYILSRWIKTGHGAVILITTLALATFIELLLLHRLQGGLIWFGLPILLSSILLSPMWALLTTFATIISLIIADLLSYEIALSEIFHFSAFFIIITIISIIGEVFRRRDEQDLRERTEELRKAQEKYESLFNDIPIGLYESLPDGKILEANPAFVQLLGFETREDLLSGSALDLYARSRDRTVWKDLLEKERILIGYDKEYLRPDGTSIWIRENSRLIQDENGSDLYRGSLIDITRQKRIEQELNERRHMLNLVISSMPNSLFIISRELKLVSAFVPPSCPLAKNNPELEPGTAVEKAFPPSIASKIASFVNEKDESNQARNFQVTMQNDDQDLTFKFHLNPIAGTPNILMLVDNITSQVEAENAIREAKERAELLYRVVPSAIYTLDMEGVITSLNDHASILLGFRPEELIGQRCELFAVGDYEVLTDTLSGEEIRSVRRKECQIRKKTGEVRTILKNADVIVDAEGRLIGSIESFLDITEAKQAMVEVQAERDFAQQVMETMGQGLLVFDTEMIIEYANPSFLKLVDAEVCEGRSLLELVHPDSQSRLSDLLLGKGAARRSESEINLITSHKEHIPVRLTITPRERAKEITGYIAVLTDLTSQKAIEQALEDARDQAIDASQQKSEFLANMSHEIRTPLNAVIGMTSLLLTTTLDVEQKDYAETIRSSSEALLLLINDILDFSKIEAGRMDLEEQPFSIRTCVEEAIDIIAAKATSKGLEIAYLIDERLPEGVIGDVTRLRQVLVNLLSNAVKFTEQGDILVSVSGGPVGEEFVTQDGRRLMEVSFAVSDTGIGIPEERLNRLFKAFTQIDASTTRKYGGTGLGLVICQRLVDLMGGDIFVESKVGKGSTFSFTIIVPEHDLDTAIFTPSFEGFHLAVIDDSDLNRLILSKYAKSWGMKASVYSKGSDFLEMIDRGEKFDMAILDVQMPDMDGFSLASEIRNRKDKMDLPLIMLSSIGFELSRQEQDLFDVRLNKPIKPARLLESINQVVSDNLGVHLEAPRSESIDPGMAEKSPLRILVAEDNAVNQKVISRMLEKMGYHSDIVANGIEVIESLQRQRYDVILMDVQMPEMDGPEAAMHIRAEWPEQEQPWIIAVTAHAMAGDRENLLEGGMDDYISKPVQLAELTAALERAHPLDYYQKKE